MDLKLASGNAMMPRDFKLASGNHGNPLIQSLFRKALKSFASVALAEEAVSPSKKPS
jgi:hypothetical protein